MCLETKLAVADVHTQIVLRSGLGIYAGMNHESDGFTCFLFFDSGSLQKPICEEVGARYRNSKNRTCSY